MKNKDVKKVSLLNQHIITSTFPFDFIVSIENGIPDLTHRIFEKLAAGAAHEGNRPDISG